MRNLSFVLVLFLVWLMGYYYYSPQKTLDREREELAQEHPENSQLFIQEPPLHTAVNYENHVEITDQTETVPAQDLSLPPVESKLLKKSAAKQRKKRSKKEKKQSDPAPYDKNIEPFPVLRTEPDTAHKPALVESNARGATIAISSTLKKKDIGYYKMFSWHYPYLFNVTVNDQPLFTKKDKVILSEQPVTIAKDVPFVIRYSYEWHTPWGKRIGAKKVTFKANSEAQNLSVRFTSNWKNEERIVIDGATKISAELLEEESQ